MHSFSRRQVITAAAASIIPATVSAAIIDPHPAWLDEWRELTLAADDLPDDGPFPDTIDHIIDGIRDQIISIPALTFEGMIAKVQFFREQSPDLVDDTIFDQLEAFLGALS